MTDPSPSAVKRGKRQRIQAAEKALHAIFDEFLLPGSDLVKLEQAYQAFQDSDVSRKNKFSRVMLKSIASWEKQYGLPSFEFLRALSLLHTLEEARDSVCALLVQANLRLVPSMLKRFREQGKLLYTEEDLPELIQEGNIALMKAARGFDPDRGYKFSTYATRAIFQNCRNYLIKMNTQQKRLPMLRGIFSDPEDTHVSIEQKDLDSPGLQYAISEFLKTLDARSLTVLNFYFGLDGHKTKTLEEISKVVNLSRQGVANVRDHALEKLREAVADYL